MGVNFGEKEKYHEIHPVKLAVDVSTTFIGIYLYWVQDFIWGTIIGYLPSVIAIAVIIKYADLEKIKQSPLGRYFDKYMTNTMRLIRILGLVISSIGAWYNMWWLVVAGLLVILVAWLRGKILPTKDVHQSTASLTLA